MSDIKKNNLPFDGCVSFGIGATMLSISTTYIIADHMRTSAITEKYFALQEKIDLETIANYNNLMDSYARTLCGEALGFVCFTAIGAGLIAAGIYRIINGE